MSIILTLTVGIGLPLVALVTALLLPFSDRVTKCGVALVYFSYVATVLQVAA